MLSLVPTAFLLGDYCGYNAALQVIGFIASK